MSGTILGFPFSGVVTGDNGSVAAEPGDGSIANGNARGANAVDWQTTRGTATQVASGSSAVIGGGNGNTASATNASVLGGQSNVASAINSTVSGGRANTASGVSSVVSGGGNGSGGGNVASGIASWVPGGHAATTRGVTGRGAWSSGQIVATGDNQSGEHQLGRQTTDATPTRLTSDGAAASAINQINLPNFSAYAGILIVTAKAAGVTDAAHWIVNCGAVRGNGVGTVVAQGGGASIAPTLSNGTGSTWRIAVTADTTNGALAVDATGAAATTINWSARFASVEATTAS